MRTDRAPTKRDANKFFLACILDYQILAKTAWENARRLADEILGDPEDLWGMVTAVSFEEWQKKRAAYSLHRFPAGHDRVWLIGSRLLHQYEGDTRNLWQNPARRQPLSEKYFCLDPSLKNT